MNFLRLLVPASAFQRPAAAAQRLPLIGNACHSLTIQVFIPWLCDQIIMNKMSWLFDWLLDWLFVWFFDWLFEDQTIDGAINMEETNWFHWFFFNKYYDNCFFLFSIIWAGFSGTTRGNQPTNKCPVAWFLLIFMWCRRARTNNKGSRPDFWKENQEQSKTILEQQILETHNKQFL